MKTQHSCLLVLGALFATSSAQAEIQFKNIETSLQYATAFSSSEDKVLGYGADSDKLETVRFQHESDYNWGSNFFLLDHLSSSEPLGGAVFGPGNNHAAFAYGPGNTTYFGVAGTELHLAKILGNPVGTGLIKDWGLSARVERGGYYDYKATEFGPQVHLNVPGFDRFKVTAWRRWKSDISGSAGAFGFDVGTERDYRNSWLIGVDWRTAWEMWGYKWTSQAFIRYQVKDGGKAGATGNENINGIPERLWIEPDVFMHFNDHVAVGIRDYYLQQSDAINNGYSSSGKKSHHVPQAVLKLSY